MIPFSVTFSLRKIKDESNLFSAILFLYISLYISKENLISTFSTVSTSSSEPHSSKNIQTLNL